MPLKFLTDIHGPQYMNHIVALDFSSNATKASTYSVKYVNKISFICCLNVYTDIHGS